MKGTYNIYLDGKLVASHDNVITTSGKKIIGKYLAGEIGTWADSISIGAGSFGTSHTDSSMFFEVWREEVDLKVFNETTGKISVRAIMPTGLVAKIYEIGILNIPSGSNRSGGSPIAISFDETSEQWSTGTFSDTDSRIGSSSLILSPAGSEISSSAPFTGDLSLYDPILSNFSVAYEVSGGTIDSVKVRLKSDESNYREYIFPSVAGSGYAVESWSKSEFSLTGESSWTEFSSIEILVDGNGSIMFDGFSVSNDTPSDLVLVSHASIQDGSYILKDETQELQIEYVLDIEF